MDGSKEKEEETCMFIGGEGGVGKTAVIRAIAELMNSMGKIHELELTATTGSAADNISCVTVHASLKIPVKTKRPSERRTNDQTQSATGQNEQRSYWSEKSVLIVDEVSMMDGELLAKIQEHCVKAKADTDEQEPTLFGGLRLVILVGDFYQFPPVKYGSMAIWQRPREDNLIQWGGYTLWCKFTEVVLLTEQMRQREDTDFHNLLRRAREGRLSEDDKDFLMAKTLPLTRNLLELP